VLAASLGALLCAPAVAEESDYGRKAAAVITNRITLKDCSGAVADLKAGLKNAFPEVFLLAGSMYEHGVCVQRDWNRAVPFYVQAWQGGMEKAADRLAAGYAAPENGADTAAALWWASRRPDGVVRPQGMPSCAVSDAAANDIDRFVAELQTWQPARLAACNYMTGVMKTLSSEANYPALALTYGVSGEVIVRFLPGVPRIEVQQGVLPELQQVGSVEQGLKRDRATTRLAGFEKALREVADRALARYPRPAGIPADALVRVQYRFETQ
jgi:hypothetical protein